MKTNITPEKQSIFVQKTVEFVKEQLRHAESGHDWWHIYRVWNNVKKLQQTEKVDTLTVELAALLHDIADSKFHKGDESLGPKIAQEFLSSIKVKPETIDHVIQIIKNISFKGGHKSSDFTSAELDVVQDADRLDAIGAIGIARTFSYAGFKGHELHNPNVSPNLKMTKEEYKNSSAPALNHFYEKLLLLKDLMNTASARKMAEERHTFMEEYVARFLEEFEGNI